MYKKLIILPFVMLLNGCQALNDITVGLQQSIIEAEAKKRDTPSLAMCEQEISMAFYHDVDNDGVQDKFLAYTHPSSGGTSDAALYYSLSSENHKTKTSPHRFSCYSDMELSFEVNKSSYDGFYDGFTFSRSNSHPNPRVFGYTSYSFLYEKSTNRLRLTGVTMGWSGLRFSSNLITGEYVRNKKKGKLPTAKPIYFEDVVQDIFHDIASGSD